jgi:hypothetical protein
MNTLHVFILRADLNAYLLRLIHKCFILSRFCTVYILLEISISICYLILLDYL